MNAQEHEQIRHRIEQLVAELQEISSNLGPKAYGIAIFVALSLPSPATVQLYLDSLK